MRSERASKGLQATLLRAAGAAVFQRGEDYFRRRRVGELTLGPNSARARVRGTSLYEVELRVPPGEEDWGCSCTCPYAEDVGVCKHLVALGFAWMAALGADPFPQLSEKQKEPTPKQEAPEPYDRFLGKGEELSVWAKERGVDQLLAVPLAELAEPGSIGPFFFGTSVGQVLTGKAGVGPVAPPLDAGLRAAALKSLERAAEQVARMLEEDRSLTHEPPPPPGQPALRLLFERALEYRKVVRAEAAPRPKEVVRGWLELVKEPLAIRYREEPCTNPLGYLGTRRDFSKETLVTFLLPRGGEEPLSGSCSIDRGCCPHLLSAVDELILALRSPAPGSLAAALDKELNQPTWARSFEIIDSGAKAPAPSRELVSWCLQPDRLGEGGQVHLTPIRQTPRGRGGYTRGRPVSLESLAEGRVAGATPQDQHVAQLLLPAERAGGRVSAAVTVALRLRALAQLEGHPRLRLGDGDGAPLTVATRALKLAARDAGDGQVRLVVSLGGRPLSNAELGGLRAQERGSRGRIAWLDEAARACWLVHVQHELRPFLEAIHLAGGLFPQASHEALLERLARLEGTVEVELPPGLRGTEVPADCTPAVRLAGLPGGGLALKARVRPMPRGFAFPPGEGSGEVASFQEGRRSFCRRDFGMEQARAAELFASLGLSLTGAQAQVEDPQRALDLVAALEARAREGLSTEWEEEPIRLASPIRLKDLKLRVASGEDWFGLTGEAAADGPAGNRVALADLLDAIRRGVRYVRLDERRWAALDQGLRERLAPLAELVHESRHGLELSPAAAPELEELSGELAAFEADSAWRGLAQRLREARRSNPKVPAGLRAELRAYQREGFTWLARLSKWGVGACLADDMGLGKTLQALALLLHRSKLGPALVVAPASVCFNWRAEAEKFAPQLRFHSYHEADRQRLLGSIGKGDVVVASYGLLSRDAEELSKVKFATVVLDEAQAVKNAATHRAKAARALKGDFRLALTGTPLENHLGELWSQYRILFPGLLGSQEQFRERFAVPLEQGNSPERREALARLLRPFLLRRTKSQVARELPARTEISIRVSLSSAERSVYEEVRRSVLEELAKAPSQRPEQRRFQVLAAITRLRQLACHVGLIDETWAQGSAKMERFGELVSQLKDEGHRALVFSQFTRHLALARAVLEAQGIGFLYLDGATPQEERGGLVRRFQGGEGDVFLISLKAGGTGLNLTGADNVIHLDPWWNPAVEDQASDRAHRIGQTRPVTVYRLISTCTVEETILSMHARKRALVEQVLAGAGSAAKLSADELIELIRSGGDTAREELGESEPPRSSQVA
ncbi:MAG: DEAD/DEAH box helicase [Myxococcaceae bacterium]